jgi:hypothetical protein
MRLDVLQHLRTHTVLEEGNCGRLDSGLLGDRGDDDVQRVLHVELWGKTERRKREGGYNRGREREREDDLRHLESEGHVNNNTIKCNGGTHSLQ